MSDEHGTEFQSDSTRRTRDRVRQMERDIAEIKYAIKGNGQPGLVRQVTRFTIMAAYVPRRHGGATALVTAMRFISRTQADSALIR